MSSTAQTTVRNAGLLLIQRGGLVLNTLLFAALVPRLMGPTIYGQFTLLTSLALWLANGSALGITPIMSRFVPEFISRDDRKGLLKFVGQMAAFRLLLGVVGAGIYFTLTKLWLQELDWLVLGFMAVSVFFNIVSLFVFNLFLGLNQASNWVMKETLKCWGSLVLVLVGVWLWGLKGACLGIALSEILVLVIGWRWGRAYLGESFSVPDIRYLVPFFSFGLLFFAADIILSSFQYSGATLIRLITDNYNEVSYFGLAFQGFIMPTAASDQLALAFAPFLAGLLARQETEAVKYWVEQLLKWLVVCSILVVFVTLFLADSLIPLLLGKAFRPVALNLMILTLSLLTQGIVSVGGALAIVKELPRVTLVASALRLSGFIVAGIFLVSWRGSLGACLAVIVGAELQAACYLIRWQALAAISWRPYLQALGLGVIFLPLFLLKSSWSMNLWLCAAAVIGYIIGLLLLRLVTLEELAKGWWAIMSRKGPLSSNSVEND
jgi:O-antigen/teichoic acid export membrane protein